MDRVSRLLLATLLPVALAVGAGCAGSSEPSRVASTVIVSPPSGSLDALGAGQQFSAVVKDQHGDTLFNAAVAWSTNNAAAVTVSTTGLATAVANGAAQVTATSGSASQSVVVTVAQAEAELLLVSGDSQSGTVGQALAQPLVVQVFDRNGHAVPGGSVAFATTAGTFGSPTAQAGADGLARSIWTLGSTAGAQEATASLPAAAVTLPFHATAGAGAAARMFKVLGDTQMGVEGYALPLAPVVLVRDAYGNAKPGADVVFAVNSGAGSVSRPVITTGVDGRAQVGGWTLGVAGANSLTATVQGTAIAATFSAWALPAVGPARVLAYTGDGQPGLVGYPANVQPAVRVTDRNAMPVAGASVTFAVASGGGSIANATILTNANGVAQAGSWTLGAAAGTNTVTATVAGAGIAGNPATIRATGEISTFHIAIQNVGPPLSPAAQSAFDSAVAKWQRIIYRDVTDIPNVSVAAGDCGSWTPAFGPVFVDDVLILVRLDSIDGPGNVLGQAGPCLIRMTGGLTVLGTMRFDTADVATLIAGGQLNATILHEMGHVLGFGTLWDLPIFNCLQSPSSVGGTVVDTYFSCGKGRAMFDSIGGISYTGGHKVPVENCGPASPAGCGLGTINSHWREPVFTTELMTGYLDNGVPTPLSRLTAAAMEDLGYVVNYAGADSYTHPFTLRAAGGAAAFQSLSLGDDVYRGPIYVVDSQGRVARVIRPGARR
jgi:hypothetical protein